MTVPPAVIHIFQFIGIYILHVLVIVRHIDILGNTVVVGWNPGIAAISGSVEDTRMLAIAALIDLVLFCIEATWEDVMFLT